MSEHHDNEEVVALRGPMPALLLNRMLRMQGGKQYLQVADRMIWFRKDAPTWGVLTQLLEGGHEAGFATMQATIMDETGRIIAQGTKTESRQDFPAGWVEKAETGAIGRALAVAGWGTQFALADFDEGQRVVDSPQKQTRTPVQSRQTQQPASASDEWHTANKAVRAMLKKKGMDGLDDTGRHKLAANAIGRPVHSFSDLTAGDLRKVYDWIKNNCPDPDKEDTLVDVEPAAANTGAFTH